MGIIAHVLDSEILNNVHAAKPSQNEAIIATQTEFLREKPRDLRTVLGIFYTPAPLAETLVDWAVKAQNELIFEPSFGGCGFLNATARRLLQLGHDNPWVQIYGCDIDRRAFKFLPEKYQNFPSKRFLLGDFLEYRPKDFGGKTFDVVLGNPPYVSSHTMTAKQNTSGKLALAEDSYQISARASLWAYFVIHSLSFLKIGGKVAWVLPRSLSQSIYGREILAIIQKKFDAVLVISLGQRMFVDVGTPEITDVLLATGYRGDVEVQGQLAHLHANTLLGLQQILATSNLPTPLINIPAKETFGSRRVILNTKQKAALDFVYALPQARLLADLIEIKIGVVTGASGFFILRRSTLADHGLRPEDCRVVISKYRNTSGIEITKDDEQALKNSDERVLLIKCSQRRISKRVKKYLQSFAPEVRNKVATFNKRDPWYNLDDKQIADAFLPCLVIGEPRMVLNSAKLNCTNNALRVWFKNKPAKMWRQLLALALASTPGQVAAEAFGRACGSGGLKLEPSDWLGVKLLLPDNPNPAATRLAFGNVNAFLRVGNVESARLYADQFLLQNIPALLQNPESLSHLKSALAELQANRE
jgi:adenine-specific DNA-methyltransferase